MYSAGVLPLTVPDHAYHGVFISGIGRSTAPRLTAASCCASARSELS
ncbi:MAG: hypothetical protein ACLP01_14265 [Solirubrobacteraceae bacterium]